MPEPDLNPDPWPWPDLDQNGNREKRENSSKPDHAAAIATTRQQLRLLFAKRVI